MPKKKTIRKRIEKDGKFYSPRGVELTRCSNTLTEAAFFSWILSALRRLTIRWKPRSDKLQENRKPYEGKDKRTKWVHQCEMCKEWFPAKDIEIDHIVALGGITSFEKIGEWCKRAFVEVDGLQKLCKGCHLTFKTNEERKR